MRILLWHVHGSWTTAFVQGQHEYLRPGAARPGPGRLGTRAHLGLGRTSVQEVGPAQMRRRRDSTSSCSSGPRSSSLAEELARPSSRASTSPTIYLEHNAPQGRISAHAPSRGRPTPTCCWRTSPTSTSLLGLGLDAHPGDRARHRRSGLPLHGRAARAVAVVDQRSRSRVPGDRDRSAASGSRRRHRCDIFGMDARGTGRDRDLPQRPCTRRWRDGACTCIRSGGHRSACR